MPGSNTRFTVKSIVHDWLILNGYDGLCEVGCGCGLDGLMPCSEPLSGCRPAYRFECKVHGTIYVPERDGKCPECAEQEGG